MTLRLGDTAPDFTALTTQGPIQFHDWLGDSWAVLFSHPRDFTPVCTTELSHLALLHDEFQSRGVKLIGTSIDTVQAHHQWVREIRESQGTLIEFPIIADLDRAVANLYGMLHPNHDASFTVRSLFVIDSRKQLRLSLTYPHSCGRNFDEVLRAVDSLQLSDAHHVLTPAHWQVGDDVIIPPAVSDDDAQRLFTKGWQTVTPYLRLTPQPRGARA